MQRREIPFRLEAAAPVTQTAIPAGELCRAAGILLDNAAEETEAFLRNGKPIEKEEMKRFQTEMTWGKYSGIGVTALFCADETE